MTSVCPPEVGSQGTFPFEADIEDKTIRCDRRKVCLGEGHVLQKKHPEALIAQGEKNCKKRDDNDDKRSTPYNLPVERASAKFS